jgi:hypothetical protein
MKTGRKPDILELRVLGKVVALSSWSHRSDRMRKAGKQEQLERAIDQLKPYGNLRFLRWLLFQDRNCTMHTFFALFQIHFQQKKTKSTKSKGSLMQQANGAQTI